MRTCTCDACGKSMMDEKGKTTVGISLHMTNGYEGNDSLERERLRAFLQRQSGPYALDREYEVCWECWLKSLGVKP